MNKMLLETIIKVFALISSLYTVSFIENVRIFIRSYLKKEFSEQVSNEYLLKFNHYFNEFVEQNEQYSSKENVLNLLKQIFNTVKTELNHNDRFLILIRLLFFKKFLFKYPNIKTENDNLSLQNIIEFIAQALNINKQDHADCEAFVFEKIFNVSKVIKLEYCKC